MQTFIAALLIFVSGCALVSTVTLISINSELQIHMIDQ